MSYDIKNASVIVLVSLLMPVGTQAELQVHSPTL